MNNLLFTASKCGMRIAGFIVCLALSSSAEPRLPATAKLDSGGPVVVKPTKGKLTVVTFGASWCKPCKKELPAWNKLAGTLRQEAVFYAINIDEERKAGVRFAKSLKLKHITTVYDPKHKLAKQFGPSKMPTTYIFDSSGKLLHVHKGYRRGDGAKLREQIKRLSQK